MTPITCLTCGKTFDGDRQAAKRAGWYVKAGKALAWDFCSSRCIEEATQNPKVLGKRRP